MEGKTSPTRKVFTSSTLIGSTSSKNKNNTGKKN